MSVYNRATDRDDRGRLKRTYRRPPFPMSTPGQWVRVHMSRRRRHLNRALCNRVVQAYEPEEIVWPLGCRKPHVYYW